MYIVDGGFPRSLLCDIHLFILDCTRTRMLSKLAIHIYLLQLVVAIHSAHKVRY
jgi:hypothetical protein